LRRLGIKFEKKLQVDELGVWWDEEVESPVYTIS